VWYTAQLRRDTSGDFDGYLGLVYSSTGTWLALPWDAQRFAVTPTGTATFRPTSPYDAVLSYAVNGLPRVVKSVERQPLTAISLQGAYASVVSATSSNCAVSPANETYLADLSIRELSGPATIELRFARGDATTCILTAELNARGRLSSATNGAFECSNGDHGSLQLDELAATQHGVEGRWSSSTTTGCVRANAFAAIAK
jgi:hypothetical protein